MSLARTARQHTLQAATTRDLSVTRAMNYMGVPADIWRQVFEQYFVPHGRDGGETDAAMQLLSVCKSWVEYIQPWVYFHLYFSSLEYLERALCALADGSERQKISRWTRRITFKCIYVSELPWLERAAAFVAAADGLTHLHIEESYCSLDGLLIPSCGRMPNAPVQHLVLDISLSSLQVVLSYTGSLVNLRSLALEQWGGPSDQESVALHLLAGFELPKLEKLDLALDKMSSGRYAAFIGFFSRCRLGSLQKLKVAVPKLEPSDVHALVSLLRAHRGLAYCSLNIERSPEVLDHALAETCSSYLLLLLEGPMPSADAAYALNPKVRSLHISCQCDLEPAGIEPCFRLVDALETRRSPRAELSQIQLSASLFLPDDDVYDHFFRWDASQDSAYAFVGRMVGHARRLRRQGVLLLDYDGESVDGMEHGTDDPEF